MSMRRTEKYYIILDYIRSRGYSVRHKKMVKYDGWFNAETKEIAINDSIKGTVIGCYTLWHEYRHALQLKERLCPLFMRGYPKFKQEYLDEVIKVEQDCAKFSQKMLKGIGIKYSPPELNPKELPDMIEFWKKEYFPIKNKKKRI